MTPVIELVTYPFLFLALFFEVFAILTLFDAEARRRRNMLPAKAFPKVTIIVPAYNEGLTVGPSLDSLLALEYPADKLSVIAVDDGSTDGTGRVLTRYAKKDPRVLVIAKQNGGKHTALNTGLAATDTELVGCLDADSFVAPDALAELVAHFDDGSIGAVTASISVSKPRSILERVQQAEYLLGITLRHVLATVNGLYVTPGPFTIYRREVFAKLGDFRSAHATEDMEIALRMQKAGWKIQNAPRARVYTKAPRTLGALVQQRTRWFTGFLRNSLDYREIFGNPAHGFLGLMVLPLAILSIVSVITLFTLGTIAAGEGIVRSALLASAVPLSFTFRLPAPDFFYVPISVILVVGVIALACSLVFVAIGARISRTRTDFSLALFWYALLYGFLAPLWLLRSVVDLAFGVRRSWR